MLGDPGHIYWAAAWIWFLSIDTGEKTGDSCHGLCQVSKNCLFLPAALYIEVRHDLVLEWLVETGPCSHLPLHSSAGFDRGKESIFSSHSRHELTFWGGDVQVLLQTEAQLQLTSFKKISHSVWYPVLMQRDSTLPPAWASTCQVIMHPEVQLCTRTATEAAARIQNKNYWNIALCSYVSLVPGRNCRQSLYTASHGFIFPRRKQERSSSLFFK